MPVNQNATMVRVSSRFFMYDNTCKYLAENFPEDISSRLIGERVTLTELNPTELNVEPIRADSIIFLTNEHSILPLEFQTVGDEDMPFEPESILRAVAAKIALLLTALLTFSVG